MFSLKEVYKVSVTVYFCLVLSSQQQGHRQRAGCICRMPWDTPIFTAICSISYSTLKAKKSLFCYLARDLGPLLRATPLNTPLKKYNTGYSGCGLLLGQFCVTDQFHVKGWRSLVMLLSDVIRSYGKKSCNSPRNTNKQKEQSSHKGDLHKYR